MLSSNDYSTNFGLEFPFLPHPNNGSVLAEVSHNKTKMPRHERPLLAGKFTEGKRNSFLTREQILPTTYTVHILLS